MALDVLWAWQLRGEDNAHLSYNICKLFTKPVLNTEIHALPPGLAKTYRVYYRANSCRAP